MIEVEDINPEQKQAPLTDWANEPLITDLKQDYQDATSHHDGHVTNVNTWLDNLNVTGSAVIPKVKGRSTIVPKLIRKQAEWRYAALSESFLSHENIFNTEPVSWEDRDAAVQNGLMLNHQFNNILDKVEFIDDYVRTAVDEGTVLVRVGWDFEEIEAEVPNISMQPTQDPQAGEIHQQIHQQMQQNPEAFAQLPPEMQQAHQITMQSGIPHMPIQNGFKKEMQTIKNEPTIDVCDYNSILVDPTCKGKIKKADFIIFSFETSLSNLKKDGDKYSNLDKINTETNSISNTPGYIHSEDTAAFNFKDEPRKKFIAYEYWGFWDIDNSGKTTAIVATWVGDTIIRMETSPFPDQSLPFILVQYLPKRKNVYGEPDGELLEDNQKISGAVTRGMLDIMGRAAVGQTGTRKDALDVTNKRKYEAGKDYSFNAHIDPRLAFHQHVYPEIPQSAPFMLELQNNEAESLTGVKAFHGGISGDALGKQVSSARSAIDAAAKRELGILRRLAKGVIDIGYKIAAMNAVFLSDEEVIRVTNDKFITIKRDDLAGRIDIKLHISTAESDNAKAQELAFMLQTIGPNSDPSEVRMIRAEIARLRKMPDLAKRIEEYQPQPDPLAQEIQMLEIQKLKAEITKLDSEAMENEAEAELDLAKARDTDAGRDNKDLEFIERESGVTQERELEKQGAQARANEKLEATKARLNPKGGNSSNSG